MRTYITIMPSMTIESLFHFFKCYVGEGNCGALTDAFEATGNKIRDAVHALTASRAKGVRAWTVYRRMSWRKRFDDHDVAHATQCMHNEPTGYIKLSLVATAEASAALHRDQARTLRGERERGGCTQRCSIHRWFCPAPSSLFCITLPTFSFTTNQPPSRRRLCPYCCVCDCVCLFYQRKMPRWSIDIFTCPCFF